MDQEAQQKRSALMGKVKSKGNRSTEIRVALKLQDLGIEGWTRHPTNVLGRPDFFFPSARLALFVDGCFWHACPKCGRLPKTRLEFWQPKLEGNRRRDLATNRALRRRGYRVMRVWEHALQDDRWVKRLQRMLAAGLMGWTKQHGLLIS